MFTQVQTLGGQYVVCLHADTGETIWERRYDWPYDAAGVYPGPRATPTLYQDRLYFAAPNGLIGCLIAESGELVWSVNVVEKYAARGVDFGYSCSPTVLEGQVLLPVGGRGASLVALSASDGRERWKSGDDPASYTPAYPITHQGRDLVIGYLQNALIACDRATGEIVWRHSLSHGYDEHAAWQSRWGWFFYKRVKTGKTREQRDVAGRHYLTKAELNGLYFATYQMKRPRGWSAPHSVGRYWRCALVLFYNYGLDTGTVWKSTPYHEPILWRHVCWDLASGSLCASCLAAHHRPQRRLSRIILGAALDRESAKTRCCQSRQLYLQSEACRTDVSKVPVCR